MRNAIENTLTQRSQAGNLNKPVLIGERESADRNGGGKQSSRRREGKTNTVKNVNLRVYDINKRYDANIMNDTTGFVAGRRAKRCSIDLRQTLDPRNATSRTEKKREREKLDKSPADRLTFPWIFIRVIIVCLRY